MRVLKIIIVFIISFSIINSPVYAGWIDDWLENKTSTGSGYFEGQKRGYYTAGSFSARWHPSTDYLLSVNPPKIEAGCGGIDIFLGSYSFLKFDYLVKKLRQILESAPAVAFDMALKTLCSPCSETISKFEAIIDRLNQLQIDDCRATKIMVAKTFSLFSDNQQIKNEASRKFLLQEGLEDLYDEITEDSKSQDNEPLSKTTQELEECDPIIREIFLNDNNNSVLQALLKIKLNDATKAKEYAELMRSYIGDIVLEGGEDRQPTYVPPSFCAPKNPQKAVEDFLEGNVKVVEVIKTGNSTSYTCADAPDQHKNLLDYVENKVRTVFTKLENKQPLSNDDKAFIDSTPIPLLSIARVAIATGQVGTIMSAVTNVVARAYAFALLSDMYYQVLLTADKAREIISKKKDVAPKCQFQIVEGTLAGFEKLGEKAYEFSIALLEAYRKTAEEVNTLNELVSRYQDFERMSKDMIGKFIAKGGLQKK